MKAANKIGTHNPNAKYAAIFCIIGVLGSCGLILRHDIGEISFVALIGLIMICSFIIWFKDRIVEADLLKLSFRLSEIRQIQEDVISREESIRKIAILLGEITLFTSVTDGMKFPAESRQLRRKWYESKVTELMESVSAESKEQTEVFKLLSLYKNIYTPGDYNETKVEEGWKKFWDLASTDIKDKTA